MATEEVMERERWAIEEAIIKGNYDALDERIFSTDAVFHVPPFPDIKGLDGFKQFLVGMASAISGKQWNWDEIICQDNRAVQRFTFYAKHTGMNPMINVLPTGKEIILRGCAVYHLVDDRIVEFFEFSDQLGFFQQLGMIPHIGP